MEKRSHPLETPVIRLVGCTTALASGLATGIASAAPGDLDPDFGDVGRAYGLPGLYGTAWSLETTEDGDALVAGYEEYCYWGCSLEGFFGRLQEDGTLDPDFAVVQLANTQVFDVALQPDGKAVAVGTTRAPVVFRLNRDGSLDSTFGTGGRVFFSAAAPQLIEGRSLVIDTEGRIVIAGVSANRLVLLRLGADGAVDRSFGVDGEFTGPAVAGSHWPTRIVEVAGGYRVTAQIASRNTAGGESGHCRVVGVARTGALDSSFGVAGLADPFATAGGGSDHCAALAPQADGRLLVAGGREGDGDSAGLAARLLASGAIDPSFSGAAVTGALREATAIVVDPRGRISVAGSDQATLSGGTVVRLQASGLLDSLFGHDGKASFALPADNVGKLTVQDMKSLQDGALLLAGGDSSEFRSRSYVVRLLGDDAGGGPGLFAVESPSPVGESTGQASVVVRRIGGRSGAVSVGYAARVDDAAYWQATLGEDFSAVQGRLEWADGDDSPKTITVPIGSGGAAFEFGEVFKVALGDPQGGAGLGQQTARVTIQGDAPPAGAFVIQYPPESVREGDGAVYLSVYRADDGEGRVSVTVQPVSGTARGGEDFKADAVTVTWDDGEVGAKQVSIPILQDQRSEPTETFSVRLTNATGGAVIAPQADVTIAIQDSGSGSSGPVGGGGTVAGGGGSGGGGRTGGLGALLLGIAGLLRRRGAR